MLRRIGAVLAGLGVVFVVVGLLQYVSALLYPLPEGLDPADPSQSAALSAHVATMPAGAWALAFGSEVIGAFLGALAAGFIAPTRRGWFAGGIVVAALVASVMNWMSFPHPTWFIVGQVVAYPLVLLAVLALLVRRGGGGREVAVG